MRGTYQDKEVLYNEKGEFMGFNLGWDFTAEHEWGIEKLAAIYKLDKNGLAHKKNPNVYLAPIEIDGIDCLMLLSLPYEPCKNFFNEDGSLVNDAIRCLDLYTNQLKRDSFIASWDDHSFGICVKPELKDELKELYESLKSKKQTSIGIAAKEGNCPFGSSGLCVLITQRM